MAEHYVRTGWQLPTLCETLEGVSLYSLYRRRTKPPNTIQAARGASSPTKESKVLNQTFIMEEWKLISVAMWS